MIYEAFGEPLQVRDVRDPSPAPGGVIVKVEATGLCRSDWHGWMGHDPGISLPHVPGHELAGIIVSLGGEVSHWRVGDRVTVPFVAGCGACPTCRAGDQQVCPTQFQPGFTAWGSFAEFVAIDHADANLVHLPECMSFEAAASLGCRFGTAFRAVVDQGRVRGGEWVAVHGCGGVGLSAIMIAVAVGANVVAVDISRRSLELATLLGAASVVDATRADDVSAGVREATGGGAHVSLDALGHPDTLMNSVLSLRPRGRHVQVGLMPGSYARTPILMDRVIADELEILGSHGIQAHRYDAMLAMIEAGRLRPEQLIDRTISLDETPEALIQMGDFAEPGIAVINDFGIQPSSSSRA